MGMTLPSLCDLEPDSEGSSWYVLTWLGRGVIWEVDSSEGHRWSELFLRPHCLWTGQPLPAERRTGEKARWA